VPKSWWPFLHWISLSNSVFPLAWVTWTLGMIQPPQASLEWCLQFQTTLTMQTARFQCCKQFKRVPTISGSAGRSGIKIARCLFYLHSVNWLHKGFRSEDLLCFQHPKRDITAHLSLTGFEYARPAHNDEVTEATPSMPSWEIY
jgi:hypothetical protein